MHLGLVRTGGLSLIAATLAVAQEGAIKISSTEEGKVTVEYSDGALEGSENLTDWTAIVPQPNHSFQYDIEDGVQYFRVNSDVSCVPVIAFTGQSNTVHIPRNFAPYSELDIPVEIVMSTGGTDTNPGEPVVFPTLRDAITSNRAMGSAWEFSKLLYESDFRIGEETRFAVVQSGKGGQPARNWRLSLVRGLEFQVVVDKMLSEINEEAGNMGYLHTVVINQGEREALTGQNWASYWSAFIDQVRAKYGNGVQFYIQSLNDNELMGRQISTDEEWRLTRGFQLALAADSGSMYSRERTFVFDANALGGVENRGLYTRDSQLHYSNEGIALLASGTFALFEEENIAANDNGE